MDIERSSTFGKWLHWVDDSLPNRCAMCQQSITQSKGICDVCIDDYRPGTLCLGCTKSIPDTPTMRCGSCLKRQRWRPVVCATSYFNPLGQMASAIKIQEKFSVIEPFCDLLADRIELLQSRGLVERPDALVAVPMHPSKIAQRGFNHAALIADALSRRLELPVVTNLVAKIRPTQDQHGLNGAARRKNLKQCFEVKASSKKYRLALVDDIITTGTTMSTLAARLRAAGHQPTQYWVLASAMVKP